MSAGKPEPTESQNAPASFQPDVPAQTLFGEDPTAAFDQGAAAYLTHHRPGPLGNLLNAPKALFYLNILYRLRLFRNDHELEPLYEDLFEAVAAAQTLVLGEAYTADTFRDDINQLAGWGLVVERVEKQRIRGYRDNRKTKYRYALANEALALLVWLEERLQDDLDGSGADTRNQLEDARGALGELLRLLRKFQGGAVGEENARRILYQLSRLDEITTGINAGLSDLNARLLAFATLRYDLEDVKRILAQLSGYVDRYLRQIHVLRLSFLEQLERLNPLARRIHAAFEIMEVERRKVPHLMRHHHLQPDRVVQRLFAFFREGGSLDHLCRRLDHSALAALRKMTTHLREMERKSHRLEDLGERLREMARLSEDEVPHAFFLDLIASCHGRFNMLPYRPGEKMDPPSVAVLQSAKKQPAKTYLRAPKPTDTPPVSMEQARLEQLQQWLQAKILGQAARARVSHGRFDSFEDFPHIISLAKSGLLGQGRKLNKLGYGLTLCDERTELAIDKQTLSFKDMEIQKQ